MTDPLLTPTRRSALATALRERAEALLQVPEGDLAPPAGVGPPSENGGRLDSVSRRYLYVLADALETGEAAPLVEEERRWGFEAAVQGTGLGERLRLGAALRASAWAIAREQSGAGGALGAEQVEALCRLDALLAQGLAAAVASYQGVTGRRLATIRQMAVRSERERLAQDLHALAQDLANVTTQANLCYVLLCSGVPGAEAPIDNLRQRCDAILATLRDQINTLHEDSSAFRQALAGGVATEHRRILVADQSREVGRTIAQLLDEEYAVSTCASALATQALLDGGSFDLLLLGLHLPDQSGLELCRRLRRLPALATLPIILILDAGAADLMLEALEAGANDYVTLPLQRKELRARIAAALRSRALNEELEARNRRLEELSLTDPLTGLANRRYLMQRLEEECSEAQRYGHPLGVLLTDIDHFKKFNDTYGHEVGDRVLVETAAVLRSGVRQHDIVARFGGEEFVVILPQTPATGVLNAASKVRELVSLHPLRVGNQQLQITISVGGAVRHKDERPEVLLQRADQAMYAAKHAGRNTVRMWQLPRGN